MQLIIQALRIKLFAKKSKNSSKKKASEKKKATPVAESTAIEEVGRPQRDLDQATRQTIARRLTIFAAIS